MKKIATVLLVCFLSVITIAQVPQAVNYQAIASDANGNVYPNRTISVRFSINDGLNGGFPEYQETQTSVTNQFGLFTCKIGFGTATIGVFPNINWGSGNPKYLLVEYDPNGGNNYLNMGSTQLVSVPYALYCQTAVNSLHPGPTGPTGSTGYNMSCNGPILFPDSASFVITPVAPHNLNVRSIVVPDSSVISFEMEGRTEELICSLDARKEIVPKNIQLAIKRESFSVNFIRLNENSYLTTLRTKLTWGLDKRN